MRDFNFEGKAAAGLVAQLQATAQQGDTLTHAHQAIVPLLDEGSQVERFRHAPTVIANADAEIAQSVFQAQRQTSKRQADIPKPEKPGCAPR